jgi:hypothetical protein
MPGHWVIGALANNQWSYAGWGKQKQSQRMLVQPFINYNFPGKLAGGKQQPLDTADWRRCRQNCALRIV